MKSEFTPAAWFWHVSGNAYWSSADGSYVEAGVVDQDRLTRIASEFELDEVLRRYGLKSPRILSIDVDTERNRRIALGVTVTIDATQVQIPVQTRNETDFRNINGLVSQALVYSIMGSQETIAFRDASNAVHNLTAAETIELGSDVAAHVQAVYNAAWQLKSGVIPENYANDQNWP